MSTEELEERMHYYLDKYIKNKFLHGLLELVIFFGLYIVYTGFAISIIMIVMYFVVSVLNSSGSDPEHRYCNYYNPDC